MLTKLAFVQGVQDTLLTEGYVAYNDETQARDHATRVASVLLEDPAVVDFDELKTAEVADALVAVNQAKIASPTEDNSAALARLEAARLSVKEAMNEGGDLAIEGADAGGPDTNAKADYDVSGNGDTSTPMGSGSTTGDESERPMGHAAADRMAPEGANAAGPDTNAKAVFDVSGNGDSSMAERQTTGDELKVAAAWGPRLDASVDAVVKIATIRNLVQLSNDAEREAFVNYINAEYAKTAGSASDDDILAAISAAAK